LTEEGHNREKTTVIPAMNTLNKTSKDVTLSHYILLRYLTITEIPFVANGNVVTVR